MASRDLEQLVIRSKVIKIVRKLIPDRVVGRVPLRWRISIDTALSDFHSHDPILVYQMGKVGSTSIHQTLASSEILNPVFHVHYLVPENFRFRKKRRRDKGILDESSSHHLAVGQGLSWRIRSSKSIRWILISGVRDPIRRAISQIFQGAQWRYPDLFSKGEISTSRVLRLLSEVIHRQGEPIQDAYQWFDSELKNSFKIDVFDYQFDQEKGYEIIDDRNVRLLLYRMENIDSVLTNGLSELLSLGQPIAAQSANQANDKAYNESYRDVLSKFRLEYKLCASIYDHPYMDHFYGQAQKEQLISQWAS